MSADRIKKALRFYFITDDRALHLASLEQVRIALQAGATLVQYRNKSFTSKFIEEVTAIRDLCKCNGVPLIINDNILLAKALEADGVHLGQDDENPSLARKVLGSQAIIGLSVSSLAELKHSDLAVCDYIGAGPVFDTSTKPDVKASMGLAGLEAVAAASPVPVVAIGGIDAANAPSCFACGADGVAVISVITRAENPLQNALKLSIACECTPRKTVALPWADEFKLIERLIKDVPVHPCLKVPPGDDACFLNELTRPVITTDTQREGVHFRIDWQTPEEIGNKAVAVTFSDLAASYAVPLCLFINLCLPSHISDQDVERLYNGIRKGLDTYGGTLGGGNISAGKQLALDLFAVGQGHDIIFPLRSSAQPGYGLYCTGPLGLARAGLDALIRKNFQFERLIAKFKTPSARFDAARVLADHRVPCVIDISDGLVGDARHIAVASGISIDIDLRSSPKDPVLTAYCEQFGLKPEEVILAGGEDYELLFACPPQIFEAVKKGLPDAYPVGRCLTFSGEFLINLPAGITSFQHGQR